jgi:hypothetical protein
MDAKAMIGEAGFWRKRYNHGEISWSIAHYGCVFLAIFLSVAAAAVLQLPSKETGVATFLTSLAAALGSLGAAGGFESKWRSNRLSRSEIDCLLIDLQADKPDLDALAAKLKEIISKHDMEIVSPENKKKPGSEGEGGTVKPTGTDKSAGATEADDAGANSQTGDVKQTPLQ